MIERFSVLPCKHGHQNSDACGHGTGSTDLNAHMGRGGAYEPEGRADVDADDDVPCIVRRRVKHAVVREAGVVHDVVDFAELPADGRGPIISVQGSASTLLGYKKRKDGRGDAGRTGWWR